MPGTAFLFVIERIHNRQSYVMHAIPILTAYAI